MTTQHKDARERLEADSAEGRFGYSRSFGDHSADVRALLEDVKRFEGEVEHWREDNAAAWIRAQSAEAKLAGLVNMLVPYRRPHGYVVTGTADLDKALEAALASTPAPTGEGERCAHCVAVDGPHKPGDQRKWLARKLMDSKLSDEEAFGIVRHHPDISDIPVGAGVEAQRTCTCDLDEAPVPCQHGYALSACLRKDRDSWRQVAERRRAEYDAANALLNKALATPATPARDGLEDGDYRLIERLMLSERRNMEDGIEEMPHMADTCRKRIAQIDRILAAL